MLEIDLNIPLIMEYLCKFPKYLTQLGSFDPSPYYLLPKPPQNVLGIVTTNSTFGHPLIVLLVYFATPFSKHTYNYGHDNVTELTCLTGPLPPPTSALLGLPLLTYALWHETFETTRIWCKLPWLPGLRRLHTRAHLEPRFPGAVGFWVITLPQCMLGMPLLQPQNHT